MQDGDNIVAILAFFNPYCPETSPVHIQRTGGILDDGCFVVTFYAINDATDAPFFDSGFETAVA